MSWRRLSIVLLLPFVLGADSDARTWARFLDEWLYGTPLATDAEAPDQADDTEASLARIEELQARIFEAQDAARAATVRFASGSDALDGEAKDTLRAFACVAVRLPGVRFHLAGHADALPFPVGSRSNQDLSRARAEHVRRYLIHEGVGAERLTAAGYADTIPVASNATTEGRAQNRRVDVRFVPAALSGHVAAVR